LQALQIGPLGFSFANDDMANAHNSGYSAG
jgi:hypothetical protein